MDLAFATLPVVTATVLETWTCWAIADMVSSVKEWRRAVDTDVGYLGYWSRRSRAWGRSIDPDPTATGPLGHAHGDVHVDILPLE